MSLCLRDLYSSRKVFYFENYKRIFFLSCLLAQSYVHLFQNVWETLNIHFTRSAAHVRDKCHSHIHSKVHKKNFSSWFGSMYQVFAIFGSFSVIWKGSEVKLDLFFGKKSWGSCLTIKFFPGAPHVVSAKGNRPTRFRVNDRLFDDALRNAPAPAKAAWAKNTHHPSSDYKAQTILIQVSFRKKLSGQCGTHATTVKKTGC